MNRDFIFDGNWERQIELDLLCDIFTLSGRYVDGEYKEQERRNSILLKIEDSIDYEPDPHKAQINAINYIVNNQQDILEAFKDHILNIIFPLHRKYIDDEEIFFPQVQSTRDLDKVLGLDQIIIHKEFKENFAYSTYVFNFFSADREHGQSITLHKTRFISTGEDNDFKGIETDLGLSLIHI